MQRLRRILGMGSGPTLAPPTRNPDGSIPGSYERGGFPTFRQYGAQVVGTQRTEWSPGSRSNQWSSGGRGMPGVTGKELDLGSAYSEKKRKTLSVQSLIDPAGRTSRMGDLFDDGHSGPVRDTFTATVHSPNSFDINGQWNDPRKGAKYIVHGKASVGDTGSERVVRVSTEKRAKWAAEAMANRVEKTGNVNVSPVSAKARLEGKKVGKGKGIQHLPQGANARERKRKKQEDAGW